MGGGEGKGDGGGSSSWRANGSGVVDRIWQYQPTYMSAPTHQVGHCATPSSAMRAFEIWALHPDPCRNETPEDRDGKGDWDNSGKG